MISARNKTIYVQPRDLQICGIIDHWYHCNLRFISIFVYRNQHLQYCLNAFNYDIDYFKNLTFFCHVFIEVSLEFVD